MIVPISTVSPHENRVERARRLIEDALQRSRRKSGAHAYRGSVKSWALPPDTQAFLTELIVLIEPRRIVEFGSGESTLSFARTCRTQGLGTTLNSFEHDPEFRDTVTARLQAEGLDENATVQFAPLVMRKIGDRLLPAYHIGDSDRTGFAQLILIDGPPSRLGGREGTLYQAMEFAESGTVVVLDDAGRDGEVQALLAWQRDFTDAIDVVRLDGFTREIAAVIVRVPVPLNKLWSRKVESAVSQVLGVAPPGSSILLADDCAWHVDRDVSGRKFSRFNEIQSAYNGPPSDSSSAISDIERHRVATGAFVAFGWPAFWWLDHYAGLGEHLRATATKVHDSPQVIVFRLQPPES